MTKFLRLLAATLALLFGAAVFSPVGDVAEAAPDRPTHIDWSSPHDTCTFVLAVFHERATGWNWSTFRATNFNLFGHFAVGCTVYPAHTYPNYQFECFVVDRHTHEVFAATCPTPP